MHRAAFIAEPGLAQTLHRELRSRFNEDIEETQLGATFQADTQRILRATYLSQGTKYAVLQTHSGTVDDFTIHDVEALAPLHNAPYRVSCDRTGSHDFTSVDVEQRFGGQLTRHGYDNVDLSAPLLIFRVVIRGDRWVAGIDIAGRDLAKRQYKIFNQSKSINATLGYSLIDYADIQPNMTVVDPFARSGVIPIETALRYKDISVNYYDKTFSLAHTGLLSAMEIEDYLETVDAELEAIDLKIYSMDRDFRNLKSQKKNAKIAGVQQHIEYSRFEPEFIDLKFDDETVDIIIGRPPEKTKRVSDEKVEKIYHDLIRYGKWVLKQGGKMVFMMRNPGPLLRYADEYEVEVLDTKMVPYKDQEITFLMLAWVSRPSQS